MADQSPEQKSALELVLKRWATTEQPAKRFKEKCDHFYRLYRNYRADANRYGWNQPNDIYPQPGMELDTWGSTLFIPYCFSTVETVLPRLLSAHPKMLILPLENGIEDAVSNMKALIDQQQSQINVELRWQEIAKDGLMYGLGVGKSRWCRETSQRTYMRQATVPTTGGPQMVVDHKLQVDFDDPILERVDPLCFRSDPMATDIEGCEFAFHQMFRSHDYVLKQLAPGADEAPPIWSGVDEKMLSEGGGQGRYTEAFGDRWRAAGMVTSESRKDIHEVLEYHDHVQQRIVTVLDRQWVVRDMPNPYWHGELPFHIYRPTVVPGEFVGIGEIEPIEDLQHEMNVLRRQRRDNATLVLQRVGFYSQGLFDEDDIRWGPGALNAVPGNPQEAIYFPQIGDIPGSSYRESQEIASDMNMTSGLGDAVRGLDVSSDTTATTSQLVQAAANARIQNKARLLEAMTIKPAARQWMWLNQQYITQADQKTVMLEQQPGQLSPKYLTKKLGPLELAGDMYIEPEGGSTQPENVPQNRQDALNLMNAAKGDPNIDQRMLWTTYLKLMGQKMPEAWLQPQPAVPTSVLDKLVKMGAVDPSVLRAVVAQAQRENAMASQAPQGTMPNQPVADPAVNGAGQ